MRKKLEKEEGDGVEGHKRQRSKLNVPQGSVWGHGAAFLPGVKGHLKRGIINRLGIEKVQRHSHAGECSTNINVHKPLDYASLACHG